MLDWTDLVQTIKRIVKETVDASQPSDFCFGTVVSESPLKIQVEQKLTLGAAQLVLTRNVTDFETEFTVDAISVYHTTKVTPSDTWADKQKVTIHNKLKTGDKVALLKAKGGQRYLVLDRVGE